MANLTTDALVRAAGGLNDADAFRMFRVADDAALTVLINAEIPVAGAWLRRRAAASYASTDADILALFTKAESFLVLHFLSMPLKARKVEGTQWALDQEGSERFEELIDNEYMEMVRDLVGEFLTVEIGDKTAICLPTFSVGNPLTLTTPGRKSSTQKLIEISEEATDLTPPLVETLAQGVGTG